MFYNKLTVTIHLQALKANFEYLNGLAGNAMPIIKSDAYGHGLVEAAEALGRDRIAVGTVEEGVRLRDAGYSGEIVALLGVVEAQEFQECPGRDIIPFVYDEAALQGLNKVGRARDNRVRVGVKFNTGMARLGFEPEQAGAVLDTLQSLPHLRPVMVASHLATADDPEDEPFVRGQAERFSAVVEAFREAGHQVRASLANSAAILGYHDSKELMLDIQRPGIAMYGADPFWGTSREDTQRKLQPAMEITAPVLTVRDLPKGKSVSYGRTFTAERDMRIAIVGAGYADAYSRGLSNPGPRGSGRACMLLHSRRAPIVGRVCMQMTAVDVSDIPQIQAGDRAHLLGGAGPQTIRPEELADWWGTIPYEVFCVMGLNRRRYTE